VPKFCNQAAAGVGVSSRAPRWVAVAIEASVSALVLLGACYAASEIIDGSVGMQEPVGDPGRGQRLLAQYQCGSCHAIPGVVASQGNTTAPLDAFSKRSYIAGRIPNNAEALAHWIMSPAALIPDTSMPSMGVSSGEARDMAAYLGTLQ
jgi:cytochrome c